MPTLQWARQLWAESNGKEYKSMFVSTGFYPEDAHSVGQIWKEGPRKVTETYFVVEQNHDIVFDTSLSIKDLKIQVNSLNQINLAFSEAMIEDRFECGIPVTVYRLPKMDLATWGRLAFNEMAAVVVEAYLLGVNPFNQPGVESYKAKVKDHPRTLPLLLSLFTAQAHENAPFLKEAYAGSLKAAEDRYGTAWEKTIRYFTDSKSIEERMETPMCFRLFLIPMGETAPAGREPVRLTPC